MPRSVWGILLVSLVLKLALIVLNGGEYTDGIIQLQLWSSPVVFFPPGYSAVVWIVDTIIHNLLISGRLVSILSSIGSLWMVYRLAKQVLNRPHEAILATLFLAISPVFNRWSLRVMTDSLFLLFFLIACFQLIRLLNQPRRSPLGFLGWIGIAVLVRYQGLYFLPFAMYLLWQRHDVIRESGTGRQILTLLGALIPWICLAGWIGFRGFGHAQQFVERGSYGFWMTFSLYFSMFETFILYWPWALTYSLFIAGIVGIFGFSKGAETERRFIGFFLITALVFLVVQSCFLSFQYRYLLPLIPLWCILAARGWGVLEENITIHSVRRTLGGVALANLVLMTAAVLFFQRATFGDLTESALFLQSAKFQRIATADSRILSDEIYREGVYNVKMKFWAGDRANDILYFPLTSPQVGDVLILHNSYSDLEKVKNRLEERFSIVPLQMWSSTDVGGRFVTLPLLPDIMVNPPSLSLTSNPPCMAFRFAPQFYYSVALLLKEKPTI